MDPMLNLTEESQLPPPVFQDNPAVYPASYPDPYAQGPHPEQPVDFVQPAVFVQIAPPVNPPPHYLGYSIFTMICCCLPLGIAALCFSISTRNANCAGQQELAEKSSKTARTLNHFGFGIGTISIILVVVILVVSVLNEHDLYAHP